MRPGNTGEVSVSKDSSDQNTFTANDKRLLSNLWHLLTQQDMDGVPVPDEAHDFMEIAMEDFHFPEYPFMVMDPIEEARDVSGNRTPSSSNDSNSSMDPNISSTESGGSGSEANSDTDDMHCRSCQDGSGSDSAMSDEEPCKIHPLLFPDVVKDVLNYLSASDVESCRLVCRTWNVEACKVLKSKRVVVFVEPEAVRVYVNAMRDTMDFPHSKYEFCIQDFTGILDDHLRDFWECFGPYIKSLEFRQNQFYWGDFLDTVEQKVPNLEILALRHLPKTVTRRTATLERRQSPSVKRLRLASLPSNTTHAAERLADLLRSFPNLEVLEFLPIKGEIVETKVSEIIIEILQNNEVALSKLRKINIKLELNNNGLDVLASKRIPFQTLHITLTSGVKATSFKDLVLSLRPTLSELKITFPDTFTNVQTFSSQNNSMKPEECLQFLTNLKSLEMKNFNKGSINFVQKLIALENLQYVTSNLSQSIPFGFKPTKNTPLFGFARQTVLEDHSLKSLIVKSHIVNIAETLTLESIARCFPHLNCLHLNGIDDDGLGVIYRNLPFLSEVDINKAKCTDQGLTGIPQEICNDMVETSTFIVVQAERYRRDLFIGSLQFLRKLAITGSRISDASIALGLADCKNLMELKIGSPLITDTGVIFITDKFYRQLNFLNVSECSEITEQSKFYAREKLSGQLIVNESQEMQTPLKQLNKKHQVFDRGIIKTRKAAALACIGIGSTSTSSAHLKYVTPDTEFFLEEQSDEDMRERGGLGFLPPQLIQPRQRLRIARIRNAFRENAEFMRTLQRIGLQQFRRLFRRELQEGVRARENRENEIANRGLAMLYERRADLARRANPGAAGDNGFEQLEPIPLPLPLPALVPAPHVIEEDDGGPAGEAEPNRLPEIQIGEIIRLGLRVEDVEFWLRNRPLFEREENGNFEHGLFRGMRADLWGGPGINFDGDELHEAAAEFIGFPDEEEIDLEAIRRAVINAFDE